MNTPPEVVQGFVPLPLECPGSCITATADARILAAATRAILGYNRRVC